MAITLIKPEYDKWERGEHNGTFRGNNLAFLAATEALSYWQDIEFINALKWKSEKITSFLNGICLKYPQLQGEVRGRGFMQGIACNTFGIAKKSAQLHLKVV